MQITVYDGQTAHHLYPGKFDYSEFVQIRSNPKSVSVGGVTYTSLNQTNGIRIDYANESIQSFNQVLEILNAFGFSRYELSSRGAFLPKAYDTAFTTAYHKNPESITPTIQVTTNINNPSWKTTAVTFITSNTSVGSTANYYAVQNDHYAFAQIIVFEYDEDHYYYGVIACGRNQMFITINTAFTSTNFVQPSASSGEKGFRPISDITRNTIGGGDTSGGVPSYPSDILEQPGAPDETGASVKGVGFLNIYKISEAQLANVGANLFGTTLAGFLTNLATKPMDYVISLLIMPYPPNAGAAEEIKIGGWICAAAGGATTELGVLATGQPLTSQFKTIDFGTLTIPEMWQSFLDYDATSFSLYLPFIGEVDIPVNEVMNSSINVQYTLDYFTGTCVANVLFTKTVTTSSGNSYPSYSQHSYQGNCGIQVPLGSVSYGSMIGSLIQAGAAGLKGNITGMIEGALNSKPEAQTKGTISANAGYCSIMHPYITITRPIPVEASGYQLTHGYPSFISGTLADFQDLCICEDIDLQGVVGLTDQEVDEIRRLCREGVFI